jgi:hypothetical protein
MGPREAARRRKDSLPHRHDLRAAELGDALEVALSEWEATLAGAMNRAGVDPASLGLARMKLEAVRKVLNRKDYF